MIKKAVVRVCILLLITLVAYYFYPEEKLPPDIKINALVVLKSKRQLLAYSNGKLIKTYKISLGRTPVGDKEYQGDGKTPEGIYCINDKNPNSSCYMNLGVSYPDQQDIERCKKTNKHTGGDIKIHGLLNGQGYIGKFHRWYDWTAGCIAVTNDEVEELYNAVEIGAKIEIKP